MVTNLEENGTFIKVISFLMRGMKIKLLACIFIYVSFMEITNSLFELGTVAPPQYGRQ